MESSLLLQVLEINDFIRKRGPYVRFPIKWNTEKCIFEHETNSFRNLIWFGTSVISFTCLLILLLFLITIGLWEPHLDKPKNWIITLECFPFVLYVFVRNLHLYLFSAKSLCNYFNTLSRMSWCTYDNQGQLRSARRMEQTAGRKVATKFVKSLSKGNF